MSFSGTGIVLDAIRRNAARGRLGSGKLIGAHAWHEDTPPEREPFACQTLCSGCKYLGDGVGPCPVCSSVGWVELDLVEMTRILRELESSERELPPAWARALGWATVVSCGLALLGVAIRSGTWSALTSGSAALFVVPTMVCVGGLCAAAGYIVGPELANLYHRWAGGADRLDRWRLPLRPVADSPTQGIASPIDAPLEAPLSKRPCVAYSWTVQLRVPGDRRYRLILVEHRSAALRIGEREFAADSFAVGELPTPVCDASVEIVSRALRERGLLYPEGDYRFSEAVLAPETLLEARRERGPSGELSSLYPVRGTASSTRSAS